MRKYQHNGETDDKSSKDVMAAIDLGTNNCRLLIAKDNIELQGKYKDKMLHVVDSFSRIVRLGEGISRTGNLNETAMSRTIDALIACKKKMDRYNISSSRYIATEACRRAENGMEFVRSVQEKTGINIEVITPKEEAELAMLGCYSLFSGSVNSALAFDIGGGSTEVMLVDIIPAQAEAAFPFIPKIRDWTSIPYGVMNISEQMGGSGYAELYFDDIVDKVFSSLEYFDKRHKINDLITNSPENIQLVSTSGTATTLAAIQQKLPRYERSKIDGIKLANQHIHDTILQLLNMKPSERFAHPCIGVERSDYILAGCAIFKAITKLWPFSDITIADRGVREGIIVSLIMDKYG